MGGDESIPIIDVFAGPGGLGEGFSALIVNNARPFRIALSIEKDPVAHETLELRAFYRQFLIGEAPEEYYEHLRGVIDRRTLFAMHPQEALAARREAWCAELGKTDDFPDEVIEQANPPRAAQTSTQQVAVGSHWRTALPGVLAHRSGANGAGEHRHGPPHHSL